MTLRPSFAARYPLAIPLVTCQLLLLIVSAPWYSARGLHIEWSTAWPLAPAYAALFALWLYVRRYTGHPTKTVYADTVLALALILTMTNIASPAQYLAAASRSVTDKWLAHGDAMLGIYVPALAAWTARHRLVDEVLVACYGTLVVQFTLPILVVGLWFRNREPLWEYVFHFHFCLVVTLVLFALFPAEPPYMYYGYHSTVDQARVVTQLSALRDGAFRVIRMSELDGLISMPSFHAAGALMVTWAFRSYRWPRTILVVLNVALIAATFMTGTHYVVDVIASFALFGVSVLVYRRVRTWMAMPDAAGVPAPALAQVV